MSNIHLEKTNGVARVTLDKPPLNVLDIATMEEFAAMLTELRADDAKVVVLAAQGKMFCAGVDIKDHTPDRVTHMLAAFRALIQAIWALEQPTVAAVHGSALGGGMELALACDFIVASEKAKFAQPEIQVGVFPPIAALELARVLPRKKAFELLLTGDALDAQTAERFGLVNAVAPAAEFDAAVNAFCARLTRLSGVILRLTKRAAMIPLHDEHTHALDAIERVYFDEMMPTADAREGLNAFIEKRAPVWQNK